jgi:hypothetical protein
MTTGSAVTLVQTLQTDITTHEEYERKSQS